MPNRTAPSHSFLPRKLALAHDEKDGEDAIADGETWVESSLRSAGTVFCNAFTKITSVGSHDVIRHHDHSVLREQTRTCGTVLSQQTRALFRVDALGRSKTQIGADHR